MPRTQGEGFPGGRSAAEGPAEPRAARSAPPPLTPGIRRHLGLSLRTFYAADLAEPVGERIETLLDRLGQALPDRTLPDKAPS